MRFFGIFTLMAVVGFTFISCPEDENGDPDNKDRMNIVGEILRLYDLPVEFDGFDTLSKTDFCYTLDYEYWDIIPLSDLITGTPKVEVHNKKLTIELDQVKPDKLMTYDELFLLFSSFNIYTPPNFDNFTFTPSNARVFLLPTLLTSDESHKIEYWDLDGNEIRQGYLYYVDKDMVMNGTMILYGGDHIYNNVSLKKGWNFVFMTGDSSIMNVTANRNATNPGYKWTVWER